MSNISRVLSAIEHGDPAASGQLLPLVYEELRKLAAQKLGASRRAWERRGGGRDRDDLDEALLAGGRSPNGLLGLGVLLERLAATNPQSRTWSSSASSPG